MMRRLQHTGHRATGLPAAGVAGVLLLLSWHGSCAAEFPLFDARTAAMGGAGIAHGISNAAFYNPALAALEPEKLDWYLLAPSNGEIELDPDEVEKALKAGDLSGSVGHVYQKYEYDSLQITIPSPVLGGSLYVADYDFRTAKVVRDGVDDFLEHRSLEVFELGFSAAKLVDILWFESVMLGGTTKISLFKSYGYRDPAASATFTLDDAQAKRDSELNFDFGLSKEYGVWKTGFVIKNMLKHENSLGDSNDKYSLGPQMRAAVAYQSRRAIVEFDLDLLKSDGVGYSSDTLYAALGWEWRMFPAFMLRFGYSQNLADAKLATVSGGIGLKLWSLQLDVSASANEDGAGAFMQAGWLF